MAKVIINGVEIEVPDELHESLQKRRKEKSTEGVKRGEDAARNVARLRSCLAELREAVQSARGEFPLEKRYTKEERERLKEELHRREKKYGYKAGRNAHLTKPKEYEDVPLDEFADPVGYNYPVDSEKRARAALAYFIRHHDAYDDVDAKIFIYTRILRALKKFGIKRHFNPDWPGDWLVPSDLKRWMEGYEKYKDQDTPAKREEMKRKWARLRKQVAPAQHLVALGNIAPSGVTQSPQAVDELMGSFFNQLAEVLTDAIEDFIAKLFEGVQESIENTINKVVDALVESVEAFAEVVHEFVDKVSEAGAEAVTEVVPELPELPLGPAPVAPTGASAAPAGEVPPAPTPPAGEEEERPAAERRLLLKDAIAALVGDELARREEQLTRRFQVALEDAFRNTPEDLARVREKMPALAAAIEEIQKRLVQRYEVSVTPEGGVELKPADKGEAAEKEAEA